MRVAVIGAGIIGITTAYELAVDGHEVTVFERRGAAAEETSFANAGLVAPGYVTPWAAPGMPGKVLGHLFSRHAPVKLSLPLSSRELAWMWQWFRACKLETYLANRARLQRLAFYSRERLHHLTAELQLEYDRSPGYMVLLRSEKDSQLVQPGLQVLREAGVVFSQINADEVRRIEPALNPDTALLGAVHLPDDEVANCRQFALLLKNEAQRIGVNFEFNTTVAQLDSAQPASILIAGENLPRSFDHVVMCAGLASAQLLRPLGLKIPMAAVYGYSISAPIREPLNAPR
ncbi:MAG: FAD-dependent oxidoreductase, partial [Polaromonas sp.]